MPQNQPHSIKSFLRGFTFAFNGLRVLIKERNMRFHLVATIVVLIGAWYLNFNPLEWCIILICIGLVICAEAFNTSIEYLCDYIQPEQDPKIGVIKDLAAAAVFCAALISAVIGLLIFLPKII